MRKSFKLENLDCANCAAKMETGINQLPGVNKASISFMTSKLIIDADTDDGAYVEVPEVHNRQTAIEWAASELSLALPVKMTSDKIRSELAQRGYRFPQWTERSVVK